MKKLAAVVLAFGALGTAAMAHGGFSISFGYSDYGRSYYRPLYYGVGYPYRSYCHGPLYWRYPYYRSYGYDYWPSYRFGHHYKSYGHHHGSSGHHYKSYGHHHGSSGHHYKSYGHHGSSGHHRGSSHGHGHHR